MNLFLHIPNREHRTPTTSDTNDEVGSKTTSEREKKLSDTTTRLFVLALVSLLSSIFYQIVFAIIVMEEELEEFTGSM